MNLHSDTSVSEIIFLRKKFASDDEAYNFYNAYARNMGFRVRKKEINKSRRPPHEVLCRKYYCNIKGVKRL